MITNPKNDFERMFGPYPAGHCFEIENCEALKKLNKKNGGVKIAEFLLLTADKQKTKISIIEAKISAPQKHDDYINDIQEKFTNSLSLFIAIYLQRHGKNELEFSNTFKTLNLEYDSLEFRLILVIQTSQESHLKDIQAKLQKALIKTVRIWNLGPNSVIVLNEARAKKYGLISDVAISPANQ